MPELDVRYRSAQEIYAIWGPVVIRLIDGASTERAEIDRVHSLCMEVLETHPACGMLLISHHGSPSPSLTTMRYSNEVMGDLKDRMAVGIALLGLGFWADTSRATTNALMRLIGSHVTLEGSIEATAQRMALDLVGIDPEGLAAASHELDRRFRAGESSYR